MAPLKFGYMLLITATLCWGRRRESAVVGGGRRKGESLSQSSQSSSQSPEPRWMPQHSPCGPRGQQSSWPRGSARWTSSSTGSTTRTSAGGQGEHRGRNLTDLEESLGDEDVLEGGDGGAATDNTHGQYSLPTHTSSPAPSLPPSITSTRPTRLSRPLPPIPPFQRRRPLPPQLLSSSA
jgi:hypothetical protein